MEKVFDSSNSSVSSNSASTIKREWENDCDDVGNKFDIHTDKQSLSMKSSIAPIVNKLSRDIGMDYTYVFMTNKRFETREDLLMWVRETARTHMMVVVVRRSESDYGGTKKGRMSIGCECSGEYRGVKSTDVDETEEWSNRKRNSSSRKCGCPFLLKGKQVELKGPWALEVVNATHNHPMAKYLEGHAYAERLTKEEESFVIEMSLNNEKPIDVWYELRAKFPKNVSSIRTIYNALAKHRASGKVDGRSQMQYLMGKLEEYKYYLMHQTLKATGEVQGLFFAHPTSIELLRAYPQVLRIECTYLPDRMPVMEILGVTSTGITFCVGCVYLEAEYEENYTWACGMLRALMDGWSLPNVIVTDREKALIKAIEITFPQTTHLLCRWHVNKHITAYVKKNISFDDLWLQYKDAWDAVMLADSEELFNQCLESFRNLRTRFFPFLPVDYAIEQWLEPCKEKFAVYMTNRVKHYKNISISRGKTYHIAVKRLLQSSTGNIETCWENFHKSMEASHKAIDSSFDKSINAAQYKYKDSTFQSIRGLVSTRALKLIHDEIDRLKEGVMDASACGCILRTSCGLPCAHEISNYVNKGLPIPLDVLDDFWRKLDWKPLNVEGVTMQMKQIYENGGSTNKSRILYWAGQTANIYPGTTLTGTKRSRETTPPPPSRKRFRAERSGQAAGLEPTTNEWNEGGDKELAGLELSTEMRNEVGDDGEVAGMETSTETRNEGGDEEVAGVEPSTETRNEDGDEEVAGVEPSTETRNEGGDEGEVAGVEPSTETRNEGGDGNEVVSGTKPTTERRNEGDDGEDFEEKQRITCTTPREESQKVYEADLQSQIQLQMQQWTESLKDMVKNVADSVNGAVSGLLRVEQEERKFADILRAEQEERRKISERLDRIVESQERLIQAVITGLLPPQPAPPFHPLSAPTPPATVPSTSTIAAGADFPSSIYAANDPPDGAAQKKV